MLNSEQKKAVDVVDGPLLILAGAGSGKTHTLTERIASLIKDHGIAPGSILAVTFTNKAAKEMRERIGEKIGVDMTSDVNLYRGSNRLPFVATFHSMGVFFLRKYIDRIGYEKNFSIYDSTDSQGVIKEIIKEKKLDPKDVPYRQVQYEISTSKNSGVTEDMYSSLVDNAFRQYVAEIYPEYQRRLRASNALDFDDILLKTHDILQLSDVVGELQSTYQYFNVDEYQDTNDVQYRIIQTLSSASRNLCVVGDDWQGIYSWRGANIQNILNFKSDFPEAQVIKLEQNYRSTKTIINAANLVIKNNQSALDKRMWTDNDSGSKITTYTSYDDKAEASKAADLIGTDYSKWAILYRINSQSRSLEEALIRRGIPYQIYGGLKFYDRKEIKDVLGYLRLLYTPRDVVSFKRIVNCPPRKIGLTSIQKYVDYCVSNQIELMEGRDHIDAMGIRNPGRDALKMFFVQFDSIREHSKKNTVRDTIGYILDAIRYDDYLAENYSPTDHEARNDNLSELKNLASRYDAQEPEESLMHFLEDIALITDQDQGDERSDKVILMTAHSAKGLEFENVIITGAEETLFPHSRSMMDHDELEEERRLWYVAMTRAKQNLYILRAKERFSFGNYTSNPVSRFLDEIPDEYKEDKTENMFSNVENMFSSSFGGFGSSGGIQKKSSESIENNPYDFSLGDKVHHPKFGTGTIITLDPDSGTSQIMFPGGMRSLNLRIAPVEKL